ncbi:MAG: DoxX family protein [Pseudomonadota bacterium]
MRALLLLPDRLFSWVEGFSTPVMTTLARFIFAAVLLVYYVNSGFAKLGDGLSGLIFPGSGAYATIFPKASEAVLYDVSQLTTFHYAVVLLGTWAEIILPVLVVIGLFTRAAAFGMIGFVIVQSLTDLFGHGGIAHSETLGVWFDRLADGAILDQRSLWVFLLLYLVFKGGGPLSLDRFLLRSGMSPYQDDPQLSRG